MLITGGRYFFYDSLAYILKHQKIENMHLGYFRSVWTLEAHNCFFIGECIQKLKHLIDCPRIIIDDNDVNESDAVAANISYGMIFLVPCPDIVFFFPFSL